MIGRRPALLGALASLLTPRLGRAEVPSPPRSGAWDGSVQASGVVVPFRLELTLRGASAEGAFFNGDQRVRSSSGSFDGTHLSLAFDHFASQLEAQWSDGTFTGSYARPGQPALPFEARPHSPPQRPSVRPPSIAGAWEIAVVEATGERAWRLFVRQAGAEASAAILRVDGDTGELSGSYRDGKFVLSHFSGARPALYELTPAQDGSLAIVHNGKTRYTALRSRVARAKALPEPADPARWTSVKDPTKPLRFSGKDLTGATVDERDPRFTGKVVLLNVMGSWCPNCHDEAPFLAELSRRYRRRGLEVVSISFEDAEQLKQPTRLRAFIDAYHIDFTVLLGGEPRHVSEVLPDALNLSTWPATFLIGRDGLVHGAHAGFASKATGPAHERLTTQITTAIERLLATRGYGPVPAHVTLR